MLDQRNSWHSSMSFYLLGCLSIYLAMRLDATFDNAHKFNTTRVATLHMEAGGPSLTGTRQEEGDPTRIRERT